MAKRLLVTSALPYANGHIHIGHLVEYIQTDIFVRFQKLIGNDCTYICADDTHGTPIMLSAQQQNISPEQLIADMHQAHLTDFTQFLIEFDHYGSTNTTENQTLSEYIYQKAKEAGAIYEKDIEQLYDPKAEMFLPDRFVKGTCPNCGAEDQYGDSCEVCSATYSPKDLKNPKSAVSGEAPILKTSNHHFFKLSAFEDQLQNWIEGDQLKEDLKNKLQEWFTSGLKDWDISRDAPYFGFKIPGTEDKYFYVWLDAPVGYIAATQKWAQENGKNLDDYWKSSDTEIHHFIGKDILYFHALFWPAMLMVSEFTLPTKINVHGFLTINSEKMSKSRGTFITAQKYLEYLNPEFLRYYYAAKLSGTAEDIDLNLEDFTNRVNADVINKVINIGSRLGSIAYKKCGGTLTTPDQEGKELLDRIQAAKDDIAECYQAIDTAKACRLITALADQTNKYIDEKAPWDVVKENPEEAAKICTTGLNALKHLAIYLKPVLPNIVQGIEQFLNIPTLTWGHLDQTLENHTINKYQHLAKRLDLEEVKKLL